jgi:hypothetical protein
MCNFQRECVSDRRWRFALHNRRLCSKIKEEHLKMDVKNPPWPVKSALLVSAPQHSAPTTERPVNSAPIQPSVRSSERQVTVHPVNLAPIQPSANVKSAPFSPMKPCSTQRCINSALRRVSLVSITSESCPTFHCLLLRPHEETSLEPSGTPSGN